MIDPSEGVEFGNKGGSPYTRYADSSITFYFDGADGLDGQSAVFGFVSRYAPLQAAANTLAATIDTNRTLVYTSPVVPAPAALPLLVTALAGLAIYGSSKRNKGGESARNTNV